MPWSRHWGHYKALTDLLQSLEDRLISSLQKNLMKLIVQKFSSQLQPFIATEFINISEEEVHFLNAFSFHIQVVENARYLEDGLNSNRDIEKEPISIALAVAKLLRIHSLFTWEELYSNAPQVFKKRKNTPKGWSKILNRYVDDCAAFGGLDAVSGKNLKLNHDLVKEKIKELSAHYPGFLSNIASANNVYQEVRNVYGQGDESDSDNDSVVSFSGENHLHPEKYQQHLRKYLKKIEFSLGNKAAADYVDLSDFAQRIGYRSIDAGGEGNCFFHAVVHQLNALNINHNHYNHEDLRTNALQYILNHWTVFSGFIHNPDDFVIRISTTGEWADHEIITATALSLGVRIRIHRNDAADDHIIGSTDADHEINLGYDVGYHYVSFVQEKLFLLQTFFRKWQKATEISKSEDNLPRKFDI